MYSEVRKIRSLIKSCYTGPAWHGPAVLEAIQDIDYTITGTRINDSHNIIELVHHMASWKVFISKKLEGDGDFDVTGEFNWRKIEQPSEKDWLAAKKRLDDAHEHLMAQLKHTKDAILLEGVPGRSYNYFFLLTGIVNHDLYHLGQILLLKKMKNK
jgi:uncharacterized damage-inducible protein DinB